MKGALLAVCIASGIAACSEAKEPKSTPEPDPARALSGGEGTVFDQTRDAYSRPLANLADAERDRFFVGNSIFNRTWVSAPASTVTFDGLGPTFNAPACSTCHFKDGRGRPPAGDEPMLSMLLRLSVPGTADDGGPKPEPTYGGQLENHGILGVPAEGTPKIEVRTVDGSYPDGTPYTLEAPTYRIDDLAYGPLSPDVLISPRVAPSVFGLGLLEAVDATTILALEDRDDRDGDGVRGRGNRVFDVASGKTVLGRFGWKANQPSLAQQNAGAFLGDMGITSSLFPKENCPESHAACLAAPNGGVPEIADRDLAAVLFYTRVLAVPARRDVDDPVVVRGEALFTTLGCATCHVPTLRTGAAELPALAGQTIHPFTDLLLHDMGEALADGRPDSEAGPRDFRTAPLWGLGLLATVNRHTRLLHDGRARNVEEAILWHGGEADRAKSAFMALPRESREAVLRFLQSL